MKTVCEGTVRVVGTVWDDGICLVGLNSVPCLVDGRQSDGGGREGQAVEVREARDDVHEVGMADPEEALESEELFARLIV